MNKTLLKNKEEFESFVHSHTGYIQGHGSVESYFWFEPEKYPCVVVWYIEYDGNGPDMLEGDFVYLDDIMKEAVEGFIFQSEDYYPKELIARYDGELKHGDKVRVIVIKE